MIQIKTADKREFWIQAPDQPTREDWTSAIEGTVRTLDRHTFSPERQATVKLTGNPHTSKTYMHNLCIIHNSKLLYECEFEELGLASKYGTLF